jgi:hypothetical protein
VASPAAALRRIIDAALAQLVAGEAAEAERSAKAVSALVRAERELAELEAVGAAQTDDRGRQRRASPKACSLC